MFIRVEKGSSVPITRQLAEQIRAQCLAGTLRPGDRLPSVRDLARELAVNVNTVFRVYERLAADKLIEMRHGDGTFVCDRSGIEDPTGQLREQRERYAVEFEAMIGRGLLLGLGPADLLASEPALRELDVPTLIVWATDDKFFDLKWAYWLYGTIPTAYQVIEIAGGKLFFPLEHAAAHAAHCG